MLKIRLKRIGRKHDPSFRIVVTEATAPPKGKYKEAVGFYNSVLKQLKLNTDRIKYWLSVGAQPTDVVQNILIREGVIEGKKKAVHSTRVRKKAEEDGESKASKDKKDSTSPEEEDSAEEKKKDESDRLEKKKEESKKQQNKKITKQEGEIKKEEKKEPEIDDKKEKLKKEKVVEEKKEEDKSELQVQPESHKE